MKVIYLSVFLLILFSCKKDKIETAAPEGGLIEVSVSGKVSENYEYLDGLLVRENQFFSCDTPVMTISYAYQSGLLKLVKNTSRGLYSSLSTAMCDPKTPVDERLTSFEYGKDNRLEKAVRANNTSVFLYDSRGFPEKVVTTFATGEQQVKLLKYDNRGNLIEESGAGMINGESRVYAYDNQPNPYFKMKKIAEYVSPFNCPNNVVKAYDQAGKLLWERKFSYNSAGQPSECIETNGLVYSYKYM